MNTTCLKHTLLHILGALIGVMALVSCSLDEPVQEPEIFKLRIQLNTNSVLTRADDGEEAKWKDYDNNDISGTPFEDRISKVDIYLLGSEGETASRVKAVKDPNSSDNVYILEISGNTPGVSYNPEKMEVTFTGRIMAIANHTPLNSSEDEKWMPYEMKYNGDNGDWLIPMWGIENYAGVTLKANEINKLENAIDMLRAVSKVIIRLDPSITDDYELGEIDMNSGAPRLFGKGYTLPQDAFNQRSTQSLGREACFNPKEGGEMEEELTFFDTSRIERYTYVSESQTTEDSPFAFKVTLKSLHENRPNVTGILNFSNYTDYVEVNPITNVVRNHVYEFTIRLAELQLLPTVKKWEFKAKEHIQM